MNLWSQHQQQLLPSLNQLLTTSNLQEGRYRDYLPWKTLPITSNSIADPDLIMSPPSVFKYVDATYPSWDQNPEYIEACRTTTHMGDPTAYSPAHPSGASTTDATSFKVGLANWNENSLPGIMYQLWPCKAWKAFRDGPKPGPRLDAQGNPMLERYPRPGQDPRTILDFPILRGIDKISTEVPWWFVEALFRLDPRLKWEDIDMLMEHVGKRLRQPNKRKFTNAFNNVCSRGRQDWLMVSWREKSKGAKDNGARDRVLAALDQTQQSLNTTRGSTPGLDRSGNRVAPPTGRRQHNMTTARATKRNGTSRPKQSNRSSARSKKAAQSSRAKHLLDVEEEEEALEEDDDDSDVDLDPIAQPASRPKRKHASTIKYAVEDGSEDSAASEFEPDTYTNRPQQQKIHDDDNVFEDPYPNDPMAAQRKQLSDTQPDVQATKKQRVAKRNDANEVLLDPFSQQPPPYRSSNVSHNRNPRPRPRHVEEVRKHRSNRLAPHSTSSAVTFPHTSPSAPQAAYGLTPSPSNMYQDSYAPNTAQLFSATTFNMAGNGSPGTSLPYEASGHGTYPPQPISAPRQGADRFEQDMHMHSRTGRMTSAFDHKYQAVDDVSQSCEEQGYFQSSTDIEQSQRWPLSQSNVKSFHLGHYGYEPAHHAPHPTVSRLENHYRSTLTHVSNELQPDSFFNDGLALEDGPLRTYGHMPSSEASSQVTGRSSTESSRRPSTQLTGRSSLMSISHPRYASSPLSQSPQDCCVSSDGGQALARAPAPSEVMQTLVPSEATPASAVLGQNPAQQALEANIALSAHDLPGGSLDPASWDPDWESFFNTGADLI